MTDAECKICRGDEEDPILDPLITPCNCKGSVGFIHQSCLKQWVAEQESEVCEICHTKFASRVTNLGIIPLSLINFLNVYVHYTSWAFVLLILVGTILLTFNTVFGALFDYFTSTPLSFTTIAFYNMGKLCVATSNVIFSSFITNLRITITIRGYQIVMNDSLMTNSYKVCFACIDTFMLCYHYAQSGLTGPVILLLSKAIQSAYDTIIVFLLSWYENKYIRTEFVNR